MAKTERRGRVALDAAYSFYRNVIVHEAQVDLHELVNSLKTVSYALHQSSNTTFKLTRRLWLRIEQALFDKLITSYAAHLIALDHNGKAVTDGAELPEDGLLELHPEGLRRKDDVFRMPVCDLSPGTRAQLEKVWRERGPGIKPDDFANLDCSKTGVCTMKPFAVGHEVLQSEAESGKVVAYQHWWELYWQAYCTQDRSEKQLLVKQMYSIEAVWGDLYY